MHQKRRKIQAKLEEFFTAYFLRIFLTSDISFNVLLQIGQRELSFAQDLEMKIFQREILTQFLLSHILDAGDFHLSGQVACYISRRALQSYDVFVDLVIIVFPHVSSVHISNFRHWFAVEV